MARDGGVDPRRRRPRARRAARASAAPASSASPRWKTPSGRAPASARSKIRYNRVFGYYIEISKSNLGNVPADYHRKQTIAGGERFITPALKDYEEKVLGAEERILEREIAIFERAARRASAAEAPRDPGHGARRWPRSTSSRRSPRRRRAQNYTKPMMHAGDELIAVDVRHPVVERHVADAFVPNDVTLDATARQLIILTGPNMGGKSTYLRQTALLCADGAGRLVRRRRAAPSCRSSTASSRASARPTTSRAASRRSWSRCRRPPTSCTAPPRAACSSSTRSAAAPRRSTASASRGRSPSTWRRTRAPRPKTIFATHYHELTDLADALPSVANFHVVVREWKDDIVFLRKVVPGRSDRSYGIQVARLAGLPPTVVARAREILNGLERDELSRGGRPSLNAAAATRARQLGLFQAPAPADDPLAMRLQGARRRQPDAAAGAVAPRRAEARGGRMMRAPAGVGCAARSLLAVLRVRSSGVLRPARPDGRRDRRRAGQLAGQPRPAGRRRRGVAEGPPAALQHARSHRRRTCRSSRSSPSRSQPDPMTYVARLRRGVLFHDGRELTAEDVVYTFASFLDPAFRGRSGAYRLLASVEALDRYTVEFTLKEPFASFPINLVMGIVQARIRRGQRAQPIGTGPYQADGVRAGRSARARAVRSDYYGGAPTQRRRRAEGRAGRHDARPRAAQGHGRSRRQRPRPRTSCGSSAPKAGSAWPTRRAATTPTSG